MEAKLGALVEYRKHLASQYADRSICWMLQQLSLDPMSDVVIMQIDGMDQAKFKLPRDPKLRATASLASYVRPNLKLHGLWIFGASARLKFWTFWTKNPFLQNNVGLGPDQGIPLSCMSWTNPPVMTALPLWKLSGKDWSVLHLSVKNVVSACPARQSFLERTLFGNSKTSIASTT